MDINRIATELMEALDGRHLLVPFTERFPQFDATAAYAVSAEILRRRRARGERPVGRKIGFTNRGIWAEQGLEAPIWAPVYERTVTELDAAAGRLAIGHLLQPQIEPEIVLHFAEAPSVADGETELLSKVDWIAQGYEIVQCHFPDWKFRLPDTIAAFGLHAALMIGPRRPVRDLQQVARSLRAFTIRLAKEGQVQAEGAGANVLDSPLQAARHLLALLHDQPEFEPLRAGEVVTTGTLTVPKPIRPGETWSAELSGIDLPGLLVRFE